MKMIRYQLRMICSWPQKLLGEEVKSVPLRNTRFLFIEGSLVAFLGLVYIKTHHTRVTFLEMGHTYLTVFLGIVAAVKTLIQYLRKVPNNIYIVPIMHNRSQH